MSISDTRLDQIIRSHASARPKPQENPAWFHTHNDLAYVLSLLTVTGHDDSMQVMAKSDAERKQAERDRRTEKGLQRFEFWLHPKDWPSVKRFVERLSKRREQK